MTGYASTKAIRTIETERRNAYEAQEESRAQLMSPLYSPDLSPSDLLSTSFPFNTSSTIHENFHNKGIDLHLNTPELTLNPPALIIALTGFSSKQDQDQAFEAGMDVFMTKPVRFREVGRILEGWLRSRELERSEGQKNVKRDVDEVLTGAKRSG